MRDDAAVATPEIRLVFRKRHFVTVRFAADGLVAGRPHGATADVAHVNKTAPVVARGVGPPTCYRQWAARRITTAGGRDHHRVISVGQQLRARRRQIGAVIRPRNQTGERADYAASQDFFSAGMNGLDSAWNTLLQKQLSGSHDRIAMKAIPHHSVIQQIVQCNQTHSLVMRHVSAHQRATFAFLDSFRREIERFVKSVTRKRAFALKFAQILHHLVGKNTCCQNRRVRRNHQVFAQSPLQSQTGNTKRSILIIELQVSRRVSRLGNSPRHTPFIAIFDLP